VSEAPRIRVLIVDDHIAVAESLYALLSRDDSFELTELAHDANEAFRIVRERQPDVVLMDQALPGMSGAEATAHVIAARPETAVIMFSGGMTDDELVTAVESGVRGYLPKGSHMAEVVAAIRRAAAGDPRAAASAGIRPAEILANRPDSTSSGHRGLKKPPISPATWWGWSHTTARLRHGEVSATSRAEHRDTARIGPPLPPNASAGKRWRFQRNMAIYVLHRHGFPQRRLADIFDLPRSSIASIIKAASEYAGTANPQALDLPP